MQRNRCSIRGQHGQILAVCVVLLSGLFLAPPSLAAEERSYQALLSWLEEYRNATPAFQPGQHLTAADQEALRPFIPLPAWEFYFYPEMEMEMAATGTYPPPQGWGERVVAGYSLKEDGALVGFTGGGFPFPEIKPDDPQAAVKVLWNMLWRPGAYNYFMPMVAWSRGVGGKLDREIDFVSTSAEFARGDHHLVPGQEEVRAKSLTEFRAPRDMAGTKNLRNTYVDHYKEDDGWLYIPAQRRPRRQLSSERTSEMPGMDGIPEDGMGFSGKVYEHTWKYLGKKTVLATMNLATHPEAGGPHKWVPHKARWELRECHVLEQIPKNPDHPYSHKLIFIDSETFWTTWMVAYDRAEQLLRIHQHFLKYSESYATEEAMQAPYVKVDYSQNIGQNIFLHIGETGINVQKPHATFFHCYVVHREFSSGRAKQFYSLRNMASGRR